MSKSYIKQLSLFDTSTGELVMTKVLDEGSQNEGEWIIMYRNAISKLVDEAPNFTTLKVFLKLVEMQEYDDKPINTTKQAVADSLHTSYYHVHNAFTWLKEHNYIAESRFRGQSRFDINPEVSTCGKNRKKKVQRWRDLISIKISNNKIKTLNDSPSKNAENIIDLSNIQ